MAAKALARARAQHRHDLSNENDQFSSLHIVQELRRRPSVVDPLADIAARLETKPLSLCFVDSSFETTYLGEWLYAHGGVGVIMTRIVIVAVATFLVMGLVVGSPTVTLVARCISLYFAILCDVLVRHFTRHPDIIHPRNVEYIIAAVIYAALAPFAAPRHFLDEKATPNALIFAIALVPATGIFRFPVNVTAVVLILILDLVISAFGERPFEPTGILLLVVAAFYGLRISWALDLSSRRKFRGIQLMSRSFDKLTDEKAKTDRLLGNIFPDKVVKALAKSGTYAPTQSDTVSVLTIDIVGFTPLSARMPPEEIVDVLHTLLSSLDALLLRSRADGSNLEKLRTVGDCLVVVTGVFGTPAQTPALVAFAMDALQVVDELNRVGRLPGVTMRAGIGTGPCLAGLCGRTKKVFDVFGPAIERAEEMESTGTPGRLHLCAVSAAHVRSEFDIEADPKRIGQGYVVGRSERATDVGSIGVVSVSSFLDVQHTHASSTGGSSVAPQSEGSYETGNISLNAQFNRTKQGKSVILSKRLVEFRNPSKEARFRASVFTRMNHILRARTSMAVSWSLFALLDASVLGGDALQLALVFRAVGLATIVLSAAMVWALAKRKALTFRAASWVCGLTLVVVAVMQLVVSAVLLSELPADGTAWVATLQTELLMWLICIDGGLQVKTTTFALPALVVAFLGVAVAAGETAPVQWLSMALFLIAFAFTCHLAQLPIHNNQRVSWELREMLQRSREELEDEADRAERLLETMLPTFIISKLRGAESATLIAKSSRAATLVFIRLEEIAELAGERGLKEQTPAEFFSSVNASVNWLDGLCAQHEMLKIKSFGAIYLAAAGLDDEDGDGSEAAQRAAAFVKGALQIQRVKVGIASGPVVSGIVGMLRFCYDVAGDTVNAASRMMRYAATGQALFTETTAKLCTGTDVGAELESLGVMDIKGKGLMRVYSMVAEEGDPVAL